MRSTNNPCRPRTAALAAAAVLPLGLAACGSAEPAVRTAAGRAAPAGFSLPAPTGGQAVGTTELHLVDKGRPDPWVAGKTRELMVSVWYPARRGGAPSGGARPGGAWRVAPYLRPGAARAVDAAGALGVFKPGQVDWAGARTHAGESAPVDARQGARPVVLYSPGSACPARWGPPWPRSWSAAATWW